MQRAQASPIESALGELVQDMLDSQACSMLIKTYAMTYTTKF